jgi:hypothetical protein
MSKLVRDTEDFRAGMAYAAHLLRVSVTPQTLTVEPNLCCREAITAFSDGMADGLENEAGGPVAAHDCPMGCVS